VPVSTRQDEVVAGPARCHVEDPSHLVPLLTCFAVRDQAWRAGCPSSSPKSTDTPSSGSKATAPEEDGMARARSGITTTGHSSPLAAWIVMRLTAFPASIGGRGTWASASCSCLSHLTTVKAASDPRSRSPTSFLKPRQSVCLRSAQGCAGGYKYPSSKGIPLLCLAEGCTVLRSRWYQSGIKRSDSYSLMAGPMTRTRDLRSHNPPTSVATCCGTLQDRLIYTSFFARGCPPFLHVARSVVSA
jgi:hypothetical protein